MSYKIIKGILSIFIFSISFTGLYAQDAAPKPSKFAIKKDADGDGVKNNRDKCPSTPPGVIVDGTGCPLDRDVDGVPDYLDKCPDLPGSAGMNGCQDKDKDGVSDNNDVCPDLPGLSRFKGCPDSDGDGIEDSKDKCPNVKGTDQFFGCADTDGDGVPDANDKCANTKMGTKVDANGCASDTDKDGVTDGDDKCPGTAMGVKVNAMGCAVDTDGDGIEDALDNCPTVAGDVANKGCPAVKKDPAKRLNFAKRRIIFDKGNATLKSSSYSMLDEVANILLEYPDYNLRIGGHADAIEKTPTTLSETRADAVLSYLLSKGVSENRTVTTGFSKTRPYSSNATETGRGQNRRVELELYLR